MNAKYPHLLSPIKLGNVTFRHRMFSAPMGATDITFDCSPGPRTQGFYELRAKGGAAAVTVSELVVHPSTDGSHMLHLNLTTPGNLAAHTYVADAIRRHGAVPLLHGADHRAGQCDTAAGHSPTPASTPEPISPIRTKRHRSTSGAPATEPAPMGGL